MRPEPMDQAVSAVLAEYVEFRVDDALASLGELAGPFDFVLIDLWEKFRDDARAYRQRMLAAAGMSSVLLAVGNGLEVSRYQ